MEANDEAVGAVPPPAASRPPATAPRRRAPTVIAPLGGRRTFAVITLVVCGVLSIVCAWAIYEVRQFLSGLPPEGFDPSDKATLDTATALDHKVQSATRLAVAARLVCMVAFLVWFYRAHENLRTGGLQRIQRSSGWVVGSFFVPFAGLVVPLLGMIDVWKGSHAFASHEPLDEWRRRPESPILFLWWLTFIGSTVLNAISNYGQSQDVSGLVTGTTLLLASRLVEFVSAVAGIVIVLRVTAMQSHAPHDRIAAVFE
jgi:hypothetical protein